MTNINDITEKIIKNGKCIYHNNKFYYDIDTLLEYYNKYAKKWFKTFNDFCNHYNPTILSSSELIELKRKKVIIDSVGYYRTKNKRIVRIFAIEDTDVSHNCHGYIQKRKNGKLIDKEWSIWDIYGFKTFFIDKLDIVEKIEG